jgi:hypothetical protein
VRREQQYLNTLGNNEYCNVLEKNNFDDIKGLGSVFGPQPTH